MRATIDAPETRDEAIPSTTENNGSAAQPRLDHGRVEFRHASSHLKEKRPGYYLILLRHEIRHRSLREKPALNE